MTMNEAVGNDAVGNEAVGNEPVGNDAAGNTGTGGAEIFDFPPRPTMRPEQAVGTCQKARWSQFIGLGITEEGEFEVINSDMTAERALWLIKWAERWAMGLDEIEEVEA